jgi:hypothetical protein
MPKPEKFLIQIRISDVDRRRIKALAAKQGLPLQKAVIEAFNAWAEKLRNQPHDRPTKAPHPTPPAPPPPDWLKHALRLDWTNCPEVELLDDGENRLWMLCASDAPLNVVLGAIAEGSPVTEIAEVFELELPRLVKVLEFAAAAYESNALN